MRLGDLDALKKEFDIIASNSATSEWQLIPIKHIKQIIDNAPTVKGYENVIVGGMNNPYNAGYMEGIRQAYKELERPQGEWIHRHIIAKDRSFDMVVCSNCQTEFSWDAETGVSMDNYKICPNCGADMRGEKE